MTTNSYTLVIGDKNFSSWSLRPWLALKHCGIPFAEERIRLRQPDTKAEILRHSPVGQGAGAQDEGSASCGTASPFSNISPSAIPSMGFGRKDEEARAAARSHLGRDAFGLRHAPQRHAHGSARHAPLAPPIGAALEADIGADRRDLEGDAGALRPRRSVPVRRFLQCRRHVRAGGDALPHLWRRSLPASATTARPPPTPTRSWRCRRWPNGPRAPGTK